VFEEAIKQNPRMVDGDDRNDMENMEDMEYQDEDENLNRKTQEKIIEKNNRKDVDRSYGNS